MNLRCKDTGTKVIVTRLPPEWSSGPLGVPFWIPSVLGNAESVQCRECQFKTPCRASNKLKKNKIHSPSGIAVVPLHLSADIFLYYLSLLPPSPLLPTVHFDSFSLPSSFLLPPLFPLVIICILSFCSL